MKLLIIDDDVNVQRLYKESLEEEGYEVIIATSGKSGLEKFEQEKPDLVTLDIVMPDMDGIALLKKMKEQRPDIPVIMSTAFDYRDDFAAWASDAYFVKSADLSKLKRIIRQYSTDK
jgi:DNA-binding response OmpR family regulator